MRYLQVTSHQIEGTNPPRARRRATSDHPTTAADSVWGHMRAVCRKGRHPPLRTRFANKAKSTSCRCPASIPFQRKAETKGNPERHALWRENLNAISYLKV